MIAQWRYFALVVHVLGNSGLGCLCDEPILDYATNLIQIQTASKLRTKDTTRCQPSIAQDISENVMKNSLGSNQTLISQLTSQGRIHDGFPDWNFVHIPKTGGDTFSASSAPLFPVGMGTANINAPREGPERCFFSQLPPKLISPTQQRIYRDTTVFCSVRNPYERAISGACHLLQYTTGAQSINASMVDSFIKSELELYKSDKLRGTCFWIPQVEYTEGPLGCSRVINFAHLEEEFINLMEEAGYYLKLSSDTSHRCAVKCDLTKDDLEPSTVKLLSDLYAADFERWGQEFGWTK